MAAQKPKTHGSAASIWSPRVATVRGVELHAVHDAAREQAVHAQHRHRARRHDHEDEPHAAVHRVEGHGANAPQLLDRERSEWACGGGRHRGGPARGAARPGRGHGVHGRVAGRKPGGHGGRQRNRERREGGESRERALPHRRRGPGRRRVRGRHGRREHGRDVAHGGEHDGVVGPGRGSAERERTRHDARHQQHRKHELDRAGVAEPHGHRRERERDERGHCGGASGAEHGAERGGGNGQRARRNGREVRHVERRGSSTESATPKP